MDGVLAVLMTGFIFLFRAKQAKKTGFSDGRLPLGTKRRNMMNLSIY
jgi:hypothetical protein